MLAALLLAACIPDPQPLWPALTGEPPAVRRTAAPVAETWPAPLSLNDEVFEPVQLSLGPASGSEAADILRSIERDLSEVNRSIAANNRRLQQLRGDAIARADDYLAIVTRIDQRLRAEAEPADPVLLRRWRQALSGLDLLAGDDAAMARLADRIAADRDRAAEIADTIRATTDLPGATEDDRLRLARLARGAEEAAGVSAAMLAEVSEDLAAKRAYVAAERANLRILRLAIANGEPYGISLAHRAAADLSGRADTPAAPKRGDSPLVVIRFDDADVRYAQPLYRAASLALERRADAFFTLVAVSPDGRLAEARERSEDVRQTLTEMGLPAAQLSQAAWIDPAADGPEVHFYVR